MLGLHDVFECRECGACGSLELLDPPQDLARYYPQEYYAFQAEQKEPGRLKRHLQQRRARRTLGQQTLIGKLLVWRYGNQPEVVWARHAGISCESRILDVGSGAGAHLRRLRFAGFEHVTGIDPYIQDGRFPHVHRATLGDVDGPFDLVMFNHSVEHTPDPVEQLEQARRVLAGNGVVMVRTPVAGSYAARTYGPDWVQLDPPRHLWVPSERGLRILAARCGYRVNNVVYDSTDFQFWASQLCNRGLSFVDARGARVDPIKFGFTRAQMAGFARRAESLNEQFDGDQACFFLQPR